MSKWRIMYDQTQFTPYWLLDREGLYLSEVSYRRSGELSGYTPADWILYTQGTPESFFFGAYTESTLAAEAEFGFRYFSEPENFEVLGTVISNTLTGAQELKRTYEKNFAGREEEVVRTEPTQIAAYLEALRALAYQAIPYYLLTQPQRFEQFSAALTRQQNDDPLLEVASTSRTFTLIKQLEHAITILSHEVQQADTSLVVFETQHRERMREFDTLIDQLGFLTANLLGGESTSRESAREEVKALVATPADLNQRYAEYQVAVAKLVEREQLLNQRPSTEASLADITGQAAVYRFDLNTILFATLRFANNLILALGTVHNIEDINAYNTPELLHLLRTGVKVPEEIIKKRQHGILLCGNSGSFTEYIGTSARAEIADLLTERKTSFTSTHASGTIGSWPDKSVETIEGTAFVLTTAFDASEFKKFPKDHILVTTQTHPQLVPYMKHARAIVTDEGGITCHAAIVSRELRKPCLVGTSIGTKFIKTGDLIRLNLKSATVTLLEA